MDNRKKLRINTALVDMTATREESLAAYAEISINAASVIASEEVIPLLSQYGVKINAASVISVPHGCKLSQVNGNAELTKGSVAKEKTVLTVNGALFIFAGTEEAIASYERIIVNGHVCAPESVQGLLGNMHLNGSVQYYPDSCRLVRGDLTVDKTFLLRAKEGDSYFATGNLLIADGSFAIEDLMKKNLRFRAQRAYLSSAYEEAVGLIDEMTPVELIPEGYKVCQSDLRLDESAEPKYGKRFCVLGSLFADRDSLRHLDSLEELIVYGRAKIPEADKASYLKKLRRFDDLSFYKGALIEGEGILAITTEWLAEYGEGVTIEDCGAVTFNSGLSVDVIREKIHMIRDCGAVRCTPEQLGVVRRCSEDCGNIGDSGLEEPKESNEEGVVVVNAAVYAL